MSGRGGERERARREGGRVSGKREGERAEIERGRVSGKGEREGE